MMSATAKSSLAHTSATDQDKKGFLALRAASIVQGVYYLVTGIWPLVSIETFEQVTGPKIERWLVYTVSVLILAIAITLLVGACRRRIMLETMVLALASAIALTGIDIVFVVRGVIDRVYLLDAAAEGFLIAWWALGLLNRVEWRSVHNIET